MASFAEGELRILRCSTLRAAFRHLVKMHVPTQQADLPSACLVAFCRLVGQRSRVVPGHHPSARIDFLEAVAIGVARAACA